MGSQLITLAGLEAEYKRDQEGFRQSAVDILFPSAVYGTALAARGDHPFRYPQRWACLAGLKAAKLLGMSEAVEFAVMLMQRTGAKSVQQAERLLDTAASALTASPDDSLRLAMRIVRDRIMADPDFRRRSMQELYGLIDAPGSVIAPGSTIVGGMAPESGKHPNGHARASEGPSRANGGGGDNGHA